VIRDFPDPKRDTEETVGKHLKPFPIPFSSRFRTVFVFVRLIRKQSGKNGKVVGRYGIFPSRFQPYLSELCGRTTPSLPPRPHMSSSAARTQYRLCPVPTTQCQALSLLRCRSRPSSQRCQRPPLGTDAAAPQKFAALQAGCLSPLVSSPQAAAPHQSPPPLLWPHRLGSKGTTLLCFRLRPCQPVRPLPSSSTLFPYRIKLQARPWRARAGKKVLPYFNFSLRNRPITHSPPHTVQQLPCQPFPPSRPPSLSWPSSRSSQWIVAHFFLIFRVPQDNHRKSFTLLKYIENRINIRKI
jgi:hypothetical protein